APRLREVVVRRPARELEQLLDDLARDGLGRVGLVRPAGADRALDFHPAHATASPDAATPTRSDSMASLMETQVEQLDGDRVQQKPEPADWRELEVPKLEVEIPGEAIQEQLEELQRTVAEVVPAEGRPAQEGDVVIADLVAGDEGQRDLVIELGARRLIEEIETGIVGLGAGQSRDLAYELADG